MTDSALTESVQPNPAEDWLAITRLLLRSRQLDHVEETELVPVRKVFNQFSARGHDFAQILLGSHLAHPNDGVTGYYRSRPLALALGLTLDDALAAPLARSGGYSDGRDIGVVCNLPGGGRLGKGATLLPVSGGVGAQYTPAVGWAQAIAFRRDEQGSSEWRGA
ncbi:MAG: pyruvate dehydrogenase, partial [Pseudomonadota bacterium]